MFTTEHKHGHIIQMISFRLIRNVYSNCGEVMNAKRKKKNKRNNIEHVHRKQNEITEFQIRLWIAHVAEHIAKTAGSACLELSHHVLQAAHSAHLVENAWIDCSRNLLLHAVHLHGVDITWHLAILEQALHAAHFLHNLSKLRVLGDEILHLFGRYAGAARHALISTRILRKDFRTVERVQLFVVHAVHNAHHAFEARSRLFLTTFGQKVCTKSWYHSLMRFKLEIKKGRNNFNQTMQVACTMI